MKQIHKIIFTSLLVLFAFYSAKAQVTIGSGERPAEGAVLDLKSQAPDSQNQTSTTGGLVLPRVKLMNINTLEPFIENSDSDLDNLKQIHKGMIIYNLNETSPFVKGLYVWNGESWIKKRVEDSATLSASNGLNISGTNVKLGGSLTQETIIDQSIHNMSFTTGTEGIFSVNDFVINGNGNVGLGTANPTSKLDIVGNVQIEGELAVAKNTVLQGETKVDGIFSYRNTATNIEGKFLQAIDDNGTAEWVDIVTTTSPVTIGNAIGTTDLNTNTSAGIYNATRLYIDLPVGRWLVKMTFLVRGQSTTGGNSQKLWFKLGLARTISTNNYAPFDAYRDKLNPSYPVFVETVLDRRFPYTAVTGDVVVETDVAGRFILVVIKDELRPDSSFNWDTTNIQINARATENVLVAFPLN